MANVATTLLEFILDLLRDDETSAAFTADPEGTLAEAGLGDLCSADVEAILPMLVDFAPAGVGGGPGPLALDDDGPGRTEGGDDRPNSGGRPESNDAPDSVLAIEQVRHIQQTYTYNSENNLDFSDSVWGDSIRVWAEDEAVVAVNGVALGEDAEVEDSFDGSFNEYGDDNAIGEGSVAGGAGNDAIGEGSVATGDVEGTGHAVGEEASNDNSTDLDLDVDIDESFNGNGNTADDGSSIVHAPEAGEVETGSANAEDESVVAEEIDLDVDVDNSETEVGDIALGSVVDSPDAVVGSEEVVQADDIEIEESVVGTVDVELPLLVGAADPID